MKKQITLIIVIILFITFATFGIIYRNNIYFWLTKTQKIKIDTNIITQSVMTFNVRCITNADKNEYSWEHRSSIICNILQDNMPSIICMQENKEKQYIFFKRYLNGYDSVATQRDSTNVSECLPIFFRNDLFKLEYFETFWLSDTPNIMSNTWELAYYRICTYVILKNKSTNKKFIVANTHLDYKSEDIQEKSIQLIHNKLKDFNLPTLIMGDFNCTPESKAILFAKQYYTDIGIGYNDENKGTINNFKNEYPNIKIDYILQLNNSFIVNDYKVIDKKYGDSFASDHFPIYAEIS